MNPPSGINALWPLVVALAVAGTVDAQELYGKASANRNSCPEAAAVASVQPQQCCASFLEMHKAIIDCFPKPAAAAGTPCVAQCLLQNFRTQKILTSATLSMATLITVGPRLIAHFDRCHNDLFEFVVGNSFDGDFQSIVCDARLNKFFECMVSGWFQDCIGFDDSNAQCVELQTVAKTSNCSISAFFTQPVRE
uniref:Uncharacterized protein n=1 Tax=Anopheles dirus TaxID=7168 RepID=A0A182NKN5_9DIPT